MDDSKWRLLENTNPSNGVEARAASHVGTIKGTLEDLSASLLQAWDGSLGPNSNDFIRQYSATDFANLNRTWTESPFSYARNLEEHIKILDEVKRVNPDWRVNAFNFTAQLGRDKRSAVVWFTSGASGNPAGSEGGGWPTNRESVSKFYWRKRESDEEWECYKHACIRGGGDGADIT